MPRVQNHKQLVEPPDGSVGDIAPDQGPEEGASQANRAVLWVGLATAAAAFGAACCGAFGSAAAPAVDLIKTLMDS
ncbi:hypothetical protein ACFQZ4_17715 [Catellatospora coxensis]